MQPQNPYVYDFSQKNMLLLTPAQRQYVAQIEFVIRELDGKMPETIHWSNHLNHYINGYPEAPTSWLIKTSLMNKKISPPVISGRKKS